VLQKLLKSTLKDKFRFENVGKPSLALTINIRCADICVNEYINENNLDARVIIL